MQKFLVGGRKAEVASQGLKEETGQSDTLPPSPRLVCGVSAQASPRRQGTTLDARWMFWYWVRLDYWPAEIGTVGKPQNGKKIWKIGSRYSPGGGRGDSDRWCVKAGWERIKLFPVHTSEPRLFFFLLSYHFFLNLDFFKVNFDFRLVSSLQ